ncbi:GNAT family N-acetyltransferase [Formosa sediminum]|uniref:GNAT family N-acetyltransferase n=1 Tax=Formosa sediminum TaxID=2594004 RepID=A0A516GRP5_9FLAO|nr:GNAT family N-acetyltransferase [Formosa sediminum]QDO94040.1 GNAT family N-acetyltransferase [Formosa sediminum]
MKLLRTNSNHTDFKALVSLLDADLALRDGEDHAFYAQFNGIDSLKHVVVVYKNKIPVACGAIKTFNDNTVEVKRMYTAQDYRGQVLATVVLKELEQWAAELHYTACVLETGLQQPEALALYHKNGYTLIPNYGQYAEIDNSRCFKKQIL